MSIGRARRWLPRSMSRQTLVAIRYSHGAWPTGPRTLVARQARTIVSCTASSARTEPSIR